MFNELGPIDRSNLGDMPVEEFRHHGHDFIDWICDYFSEIESYPVLSSSEPGAIKRRLPGAAPEKSMEMEKIFADFIEIIIPGLTHWNHPNFYAYFSISSSGPSILGELLIAALNINAMLWKTSPAATELEETVLEWMRKLLHLPEGFLGMMVDFASVATLCALIAAREKVKDLNIRVKGFPRTENAPSLCFYCSDQTHSSIDKAAIIIGVGLENLRKIESDKDFRMRTDLLEERIKEDLKNGHKPFAVVATIGTTSTTSIDPIPEIGKICRKYNLWLHVDGAYGGNASILPEYSGLMDGLEYADSYVINPYKWMSMTIDGSLFYFRDPDFVEHAFSIVPEYLKTVESQHVTDYMNYGIQLGRRFRALKLWFLLQYFGRDGIVNRIRETVRLGRLFQSLVEENPDFEIMAPAPFSVVCFRFNPRNETLDEAKLEKLNVRLMDEVNNTGKIFIEHTKLKGRYTLRFAIGNIRTAERHIRSAWKLIADCAEKLVHD